MRVIDAFDGPVRAVAVSADGRFLAAAGDKSSRAAADWLNPNVRVWDWGGSEPRWQGVTGWDPPQLCFSPDGRWLIASEDRHTLLICETGGTTDLRPQLPNHRLVGGVAVSPDGKHLVVSQAGGRLARWAVPGPPGWVWRQVAGFDDHWPEFARLAFSPDGQYIAGFNLWECGLRFAVSGGLQARVPRVNRAAGGFVSFSPDSRTLVCGWEDGVRVIDTASGREVRRPVESRNGPFRDGAFTGTGRHVGTVGGDGVLRLWDAGVWAVDRAYDWRAGKLTCVAFTADGLAGVCGTAAGRLVLFDLD